MKQKQVTPELSMELTALGHFMLITENCGYYTKNRFVRMFFVILLIQDKYAHKELLP